MHTPYEYQETLSSSADTPCVSDPALLYWLETSNAVKNRRGEHICPLLVDSSDSDIPAFHRQGWDLSSAPVDIHWQVKAGLAHLWYTESFSWMDAKFYKMLFLCLLKIPSFFTSVSVVNLQQLISQTFTKLLWFGSWVSPGGSLLKAGTSYNAPTRC